MTKENTTKPESKTPPAKTPRAPKKAAKKAAPEAKSQPPITVHCLDGDRFCRAGRCFGPEPELITHYTPEQREAWEAEVHLAVSTVQS